jgi:hypothetical protein
MNLPRAVLVLLASAALAQQASADGLDLRFGAFAPRADSGARAADRYDLFQDQRALHLVNDRDIKKDDWVGACAGIELNLNVARYLEVGVHVDGYGRKLRSTYRDYTRSDGSEIGQTLDLTIVPVGISLRLVPPGRRARVAPYAALGADLFVWKYETYGDLIDFSQEDLPVLNTNYKSTGVAPGIHVAVGLRVPITYDLALTGEARYQWAEQNMGGDFSQNRIDLSGASATLGLRVRF